MSDLRLPKKMPLVDLEPLPEPGGALGPYASSGLKSITGTSRNPSAINEYYSKPELMMSAERSPTITCAHPQLELWLRMLQGFDPKLAVKQLPREQWPLTHVIPRVVPSSSFPHWPIPAGTYWIDYAQVTSSLRKVASSDWQLALTSAFPKDSTLLLGSIGDRAQRLSMWTRRHELLASPFFRQFQHLVCPDFSSYLNDPYPQGLAGERLTQEWASLASRMGYNVIPTLSWQNRTALRRQADLLGAMAPDQVNTVYIEWLSTGVSRTDWLWSRLEDFAEGLAHLPIRWLFSGAESGWFIRELLEILPRRNFHVVTVWPFMQTKFDPGLEDQKSKGFRRRIARLEALHRGELLPPAQPRPENPLGALLSDI